jgi:uncharacterized membrane protein YfcA/glyoxylase-like metal-dependent hydrolase (beta-lactamase superfamily II)/rhodanese-related sulfurtransferase
MPAVTRSVTGVLTVALGFGVGVALGLFGGGGSVLSVPLLVYVAGWSPHRAAAGSLFVVGVTSAVGLVPHARQGRVHWRSGLVFGLAGMAGAYAGGRLADPVPDGVLLGAFAVLMLAAGTGMLRGRSAVPQECTVGPGALPSAPARPAVRPPLAAGLGVAVGLTTGFVGAGGGFVIVPALVLVAGLSMPAAVGTSLLVISMQSAAGLAGHLAGSPLPWPTTLAITASAVAGSLAGSRFTGRIPAETLRRAFGAGVLAVAALILAEQLPAPARHGAGPWLLALAAALAALAADAARRRLGDTRAHATPSPTSWPTPTSRPETPMPATPTIPRPSSMIFTQFYLDCLSQASYLIGDSTTGQAVVVDPRRDVREYLDEADRHGLRILGVINTHFHADFLSGHLELARATGAWIGYGRRARTEFPSRPLAHGDRITLGDVTLEILETPGHTPESISVLVHERPADEIAYGVLTGDALFIGDVGRPDLLASLGARPEDLARELYHSIQHTLMGLPDPVRVFPGHGAGSACGKNLSTERQSTIGRQRDLNYACRPMPEQDFVAIITADQPSAPDYFGYDALLNRQQREVYDADRPVAALDPADVQRTLAGGAVVLDARPAADFATGHLPGALNVPADGRFAETAGMVLSPETEVVLIAPEGRAAEVAMRLARIGFDRVAGQVADPEAALLARREEVRQASRLTAVQLAGLAAPPLIVDVRTSGERAAGHLPGSLHLPLAQLRRRLDEIPTDVPVVVYCAGGWRSSVAASLLRHSGRADVSDLLGGYAAWRAAQEPAALP